METGLKQVRSDWLEESAGMSAKENTEMTDGSEVEEDEEGVGWMMEGGGGRGARKKGREPKAAKKDIFHIC